MAGTLDEIELEEGECSGSDNNEQVITVDAPSVFDVTSGFKSSSFHSRIPQIVINSDDSNEDTDDDYPSSTKKSCNPFQSGADNPYSADVPFVNPLLNSPKTASRTSHPTLCSQNQGEKKKKRNNVWGSVITEQTLSHDIKGFMVEVNDDSNFRDVESYDYTRAQNDDRPQLQVDSDDNSNNGRDDPFADVVDLEKEVKRHESRKRKRKAKERLGSRSFIKSKPRTLGVTELNSVEEVVKAITSAMNEENVTLFSRIVETIGQEKAIRLYYMTEDVEDAGGMYTNNGFRRRTPGGVYIQLLRSESLVSEETINHIFQEEDQKWKTLQKERRKIKKAARKKWKRQQAKNKMDIDRPETPTPSDDLDVLSAVDSNNEFDAADLPERPATPEPKDDSSEGEEEEEEEDEDISVAIAKAKAALLKKQRELAKQSSEELVSDFKVQGQEDISENMDDA